MHSKLGHVDPNDSISSHDATKAALELQANKEAGDYLTYGFGSAHNNVEGFAGAGYNKNRYGDIEARYTKIFAGGRKAGEAGILKDAGVIKSLKLEQVEVLNNGLRDHLASIHVDFPVSQILLSQVVTILDNNSGVVCGTKFERAHMKCAQMNPELNNRQNLGLSCGSGLALQQAAQAQVDRKSDPIVKNPFNVAVTEISTRSWSQRGSPRLQKY